MPDPADKSDDLIAELAKLMASAPGGSSGGVQPLSKPTPLNTAPAPQPASPAASQQPAPFRIPGMEAPIAPRPAAPPPQPQPDQRAPSTGSIRIPGMDQPAPVSTSAPVGKFDFGGKPAVAPIKQEPLSSFTDRLQGGRNLANDAGSRAELAPRADAPPAPIRIPSDLRPVSENKSFAESPSLGIGRPASAPGTPSSAPANSASDFHFDFGISANPQPAPEPPRQVPPAPITEPEAEPEEDPIAALIAADMADGEGDTDDEIEAAYELEPEPARPAAVVTPMIRAAAPQAPKVTQMAPANQAQPRQQGNSPIPLKPVSVAPRSAVEDRFAISPGVGLNMKPPASQKLSPQPRTPEPVSEYDESDPMSEIESLIGEAVRVELTPGPVRVQTPQQVAPKVQLEGDAELKREIRQRHEPAPVVPPLTTSFAPRRANLKDEAQNASAEDAILAAAAASGAEVGRLEPQLGDESPYRRLKVKPQRSSFLSGGMRQYVGMAVAGTLLLAAGLGLYWVLNMGRTSNSAANAAPQLTADATPIKVKPAATPTPSTDSAKSPVLAKMDGTSSAPSKEQLVSTDETNGGAVTRDVTPTTTTADNSDENGLANRKVRTVTVRPDGTIVSGDSALAGGEALPIDRPNVPAVPSTETTNLLGNQSTSADPATTDPTAADATTQVADAQPVIDPTAVAPTPMNFPVRNTAAPLALTAAPKNTKVNALAPTTNNSATDLLGDSQDPQVAAVTPPKKTPAPAPTAASSGGGNAPAYVQLSSQPTQGDAQAAIKSATAKYGSLFGGNSLTIQQVDLGQKGVKWRVRLPAASLSEAASICSQIKAQGGDCFPTKG